MNNREELVKYYKNQGYQDLDYANINAKAFNAMQNSQNKQWHQVGKCLHLVACHDLKVFFMVDSSD